MSKSRIEAFSDGVLAIVITIMVLEMRAPDQAARLVDLLPLLPIFLSYVLSFLYLGIYWNNHHHLFQAAAHPNAAIMWANHHLLFWLSLIPFVTEWMGHNDFQSVPTALYGLVLLMSAIAYTILQSAIVRTHGRNSALARAIGVDWKGKLSLCVYLIAVAAAFVSPWIAGGLYLAVAILWLIPDRRIEQALADGGDATADSD